MSIIYAGYVTDIVEDARVYSLHANRKTINLEDIKLAVSQKLDHSFTSPPPREVDLCKFLFIIFILFSSV